MGRFAKGHRHPPTSGADLDGQCVYKMACGSFCSKDLQLLVLTPIISMCIKTACGLLAEGHLHILQALVLTLMVSVYIKWLVGRFAEGHRHPPTSGPDPVCGHRLRGPPLTAVRGPCTQGVRVRTPVPVESDPAGHGPSLAAPVAAVVGVAVAHDAGVGGPSGQCGGAGGGGGVGGVGGGLRPGCGCPCCAAAW